MPNNNPQQTTAQQQIARAAEGATKTAARLGESAEHVTSAAIEKVRQARDDAQSGIEQQRSEITGRIRRLGAVLRAGSETLGVDDPLAQQLFASAGERIEQVADYLGDITPGELANDVTSLARRRPGLFFGGSFILGLALGRFVKSSASAASGSVSDQSDQHEDTMAVRPATRGGQSRPGPTQTAQRSESSARAYTEQPRPSTGAVSSSGAAPGGTASATAPRASSYGPTSSPSAASAPVQSSSSAPASSTPRDVERGEGSKS
jgi:hypothetical protein